MLRFEERDRPSFIELAKLVLTTDSVESPLPKSMLTPPERNDLKKEESKAPPVTASPSRK